MAIRTLARIYLVNFFSLFSIVLDNLYEVFGCFLTTDFISTMFGFSKAFGCWATIFDRFTDFVPFLLKNPIIILLRITRIRGFFSVNVVVNNCRSIFF